MPDIDASWPTRANERPRIVPTAWRSDKESGFDPPLTDAERVLVTTLSRRVSSDWTIYVRPQIGVRSVPVALLSPKAGLLLIGLIPGSRPPLEVARHLEHVRNELTDVLVPRLGEWAEHTQAMGTAAVAVVHEDVLLSGEVNGHLTAWIESMSTKFEPGIVAAIDHVIGDRWVEPLAPPPFHPDGHHAELLRSKPGYLLIRGGPGSGKSLVLAYRAANAARDGKRVLIATYNRSHVNYIDHLLDTVPIRFRRRLVSVTHFHGLCDELAFRAGTELPRPGSGSGTTDHRSVFETRWPDAVLRALKSGSVEGGQYDACYIDDGQDFLDGYFAVVDALARDPKEVVVAVDDDQNLYGRQSTFYPKTRAPRGRWETYRLAPSRRLRGPTRRVAQRLQLRLGLEPEEQEADVLEPGSTPQAVHIAVSSRAEAGVVAADLVVRSLTQEGLSPADVAVLVPTRQFGAALIRLLVSRGIEAQDTFPPLPDDAGMAAGLAQPNGHGSIVFRQRRALAWSDPRVKVSTIHAFKGWEAQRVICVLPGLPEPAEQTTAYVGITRSTGDLFVITTDDVLGLGEFMTSRSAIPVDAALADRFRQYLLAAEPLTVPFESSLAQDDPGVEWNGIDAVAR